MTTLKVGSIEHPDGGSNSVSLGGTGGIKLPQGTTAQRPTGAAGLIRFNTNTGQTEYWSSTSTTPQWRNIRDAPLVSMSVEYLVVAGGGAGGAYYNAYTDGGNGGDSRWSDKIAIGGGGGSSESTGPVNPGGSGGSGVVIIAYAS